MYRLEHHTSRRPRAIMSAALIAGLLVTNAHATVLSNIKGAVSVNSGNGFQPASIGSALAPGDRVRTGDGSASILYDNGCSTRVGPQKVAIVFSEPPACNVGGLKDGVAMTPAEPPAEAPLLGGLLVVGGAIGLAAALAGHGEKPPVVVPVSP